MFLLNKTKQTKKLIKVSQRVSLGTVEGEPLMIWHHWQGKVKVQFGTFISNGLRTWDLSQTKKRLEMEEITQEQKSFRTKKH